MFILGRLKHIILITIVLFIVMFFRWNGRVSLVESLVYLAGEKTSILAEVTFLPYGDTERVKDRLKDSEMKNAKLTRDLADAEEEILRLKLAAGVQSFIPPGAEKGLVARIIGRSPVSWSGEVITDLGKEDGVREGFIALGADGLAGVVTQALDGNSTVRLITGRGVAVSALSERGSAYGMVLGDGIGGLRMESVPSQSDLVETDLVYTSGLGGVYPRNLPVGRVSSVEWDEERLSPVVEVTPAADMNNLYYLLLVEP